MICGFLRPVGEYRTINVCIKTDPNHTDEHLFMPWSYYEAEQQQIHRERGTALPAWLTELALKVKTMNRDELIKALHEDPTLRREKPVPAPPPLPGMNEPDYVKEQMWRDRQAWERDHGPGHRNRPEPVPCPSFRRNPDYPARVQYCGRWRVRGEPHEHGNWMDEPHPVPWSTTPQRGGDEDLQPGYVPPGEQGPTWDPATTRPQCTAIRRDPQYHGEEERLQQCGRELGHPEDDRPTLGAHDNWVDLQAGGTPMGRSSSETWKDVDRGDPDAWRDPDAGTRAAEPLSGQTPDASVGWGATGRGKKRGKVTHIDFKIPPEGGGGASMASVAEVKSSLDAATHSIGEAQEAIRAAKQKLDEAIGSAMAALDGSGHDSVHTGNAHLGDASGKLDEVMHTLLAAIESYQQYGGGL